MISDIKKQTEAIIGEVEQWYVKSKSSKSLLSFIEIFYTNVIKDAKRRIGVEDLSLIDAMVKHDRLALDLAINKLEYSCRWFQDDGAMLTGSLLKTGLLPQILALFCALLGLLSIPESVIPILVIKKLLKIFFWGGIFWALLLVREIFVIPSIIETRKGIFLLRQAILLKEKLGDSLSIVKEEVKVNGKQGKDLI